VVLLLAVLTTVIWLWVDPSRAWFAATSVLIVACPCALALASPFALGTAQRLMGRARFFLKDSSVVETLAGTTALVFDKTGTITQSGVAEPEFVGAPLSAEEKSLVLSLVRQSSHPLSVRLRDNFTGSAAKETTDFVEQTGLGLTAMVGGRKVQVGSSQLVGLTGGEQVEPNVVFVTFDGVVRGHFRFANRFRPGLREVVSELKSDMKISLISGDHEGDRGRVSEVLGNNADLHFNQSPSEKLHFVNRMVEAGERVIMVGDGLNDAGALRAATVGLTVVEDDAAFTPSSDGVLGARSFRRLPDVISFARGTVTVIKISFGISLAYNLVGLAFAVQGKLSPVVAAVLMPASSVTVVLFSTLATGYLARRKGLF
jgi:P-type Cu+ transporter